MTLTQNELYALLLAAVLIAALIAVAAWAAAHLGATVALVTAHIPLRQVADALRPAEIG